MKTPYEELELEVIRFKTEDIITTSALNNDPPVSEQQYVYYGTGYVVGIGTVDLFKPAGWGGSLGDPAYIFYNGEYIKVIPDNVEEDNNAWYVASS